MTSPPFNGFQGKIHCMYISHRTSNRSCQSLTKHKRKLKLSQYCLFQFWNFFAWLELCMFMLTESCSHQFMGDGVVCVIKLVFVAPSTPSRESRFPWHCRWLDKSKVLPHHVCHMAGYAHTGCQPRGPDSTHCHPAPERTQLRSAIGSLSILDAN